MISGMLRPNTWYEKRNMVSGMLRPNTWYEKRNIKSFIFPSKDVEHSGDSLYH